MPRQAPSLMGSIGLPSPSIQVLKFNSGACRPRIPYVAAAEAVSNPVFGSESKTPPVLKRIINPIQVKMITARAAALNLAVIVNFMAVTFSSYSWFKFTIACNDVKLEARVFEASEIGKSKLSGIKMRETD